MPALPSQTSSSRGKARSTGHPYSQPPTRSTSRRSDAAHSTTTQSAARSGTFSAHTSFPWIEYPAPPGPETSISDATSDYTSNDSSDSDADYESDATEKDSNAHKDSSVQVTPSANRGQRSFSHEVSTHTAQLLDQYRMDTPHPRARRHSVKELRLPPTQGFTSPSPARPGPLVTGATVRFAPSMSSPASAGSSAIGVRFCSFSSTDSSNATELLDFQQCVVQPTHSPPTLSSVRHRQLSGRRGHPSPGQSVRQVPWPNLILYNCPSKPPIAYNPATGHPSLQSSCACRCHARTWTRRGHRELRGGKTRQRRCSRACNRRSRCYRNPSNRNPSTRPRCYRNPSTWHGYRPLRSAS